MTIPVSLLYDVEQVIRDGDSPPPARAALLMRHSERYPIENPADTYLVGLTEEGVRLAEELGALFGERFSPGRLRCSPVGRCRATVEAIARGAGWAVKVRSDYRLSHPYNALAWDHVWRVQTGGANHGNGKLPAPLHNVLRWVAGPPQTGRQAYLPLFNERPMLDVLVTHDTIIGAVAGSLLSAPVTGEHWPDYLEGLLFWWEEDLLRVRWRGAEHVVNADFSPVASR